MGNFYTKAEASFKHSVFEFKTSLMQPKIKRVARQMLALENASAAELKSLQRRNCSAIALYAFQNTNFYEDYYRSHGFSASDIADPESFPELPVITKNQLREHNKNFISRSASPKRWLPSRTGGSTGEPLELLHDKDAPTAAFWWTAYRWAGALPSSDVGFIQRERRERSQRWAEMVQWWPTRRVFLDSRMMTAHSISQFVTTFRQNPNFIIIGYVGAVLELADHLQRTGEQLPGLQSVSVTAAPLDAASRAQLERVFNVPVLNQYRSAEIPWIAAQCRQGSNLHILASHRYVEINQPGSGSKPAARSGNLLITDFANKVFPLVKYDIGDTSSFAEGTCLCGSSLPMLRPVDGRVTDTLRLPGGRAITGGLTGLFNKYPHAVRQFQIFQGEDRSLTLRCIATNAAALPDIERARADLASLVEGLVPVSVQLVDTIPHDRGKSRIVQTEVPRS
ncbi:phenylacetate--CoA ligase family protein [Glutamicibacter arilaitensis]|uniref:phenylacetate--CoA ligase family protein n=1 Tax=Glutamicibacter arilaitensis TaxID=256701 RepID=UPI003FD11121